MRGSLLLFMLQICIIISRFYSYKEIQHIYNVCLLILIKIDNIQWTVKCVNLFVVLLIINNIKRLLSIVLFYVDENITFPHFIWILILLSTSEFFVGNDNIRYTCLLHLYFYKLHQVGYLLKQYCSRNK